jgi:hypothetical protein
MPKKRGPARTCTCGHSCDNKGQGSREQLTAIGPIRLERIFFSCPDCHLGGYAVDDRIGLDGWLSERAEQMIALAGTHQAFTPASFLLKELVGWTVSHETIRQVCYRQADKLAKQRQATCPEAQPFQQANGAMEFQTDATKVNTLEGWHDMKIAVFAKRLCGEPASAEEWDKRKLPVPTSRFAFAAIEEIGEFAPQWWGWAERLGVGEQKVNVYGDGAEWIWEHAEMRFANWEGTLDIYHSSEWLSGAAKAACGEGTQAAAQWLKEARLALLKAGYVGLCEYVNQSAEWVPNRAGLEEASPGLLNYLCGHRDRLNYAKRLHTGEPIGSGLIEGACKQMIGRRMKQTGARWDVTNANRMAFLCSLAYTDSFPLYFNAA